MVLDGVVLVFFVARLKRPEKLFFSGIYIYICGKSRAYLQCIVFFLMLNI